MAGASTHRWRAAEECSGARYRLIDHPPEGHTDLVSALRGHDVAQTAKCLVVMVKVGKKQTRYALAVVPGDARLDLQAVKALLTGTYAASAGQDKAEELAGSATGTILPFSYHPRLEVIAGPALLAAPERPVDRAGHRGLRAPGCSPHRPHHRPDPLVIATAGRPARGGKPCLILTTPSATSRCSPPCRQSTFRH